jgi:hypothetical protein
VESAHDISREPSPYLIKIDVASEAALAVLAAAQLASAR